MENKFSYNDWVEYLQIDKEMSSKWKSLISLGENVNSELVKSLDGSPRREAMRRRRELTAKNIFNILNKSKERPDFRWQRKMIWDEKNERYDYVIQCLNPSSDFMFRKIKEERGVVSMYGESINKYLQPISDKIWALKEAKKVSINPDIKKSDLSYESLKTNISMQINGGVENHEGGNDKDIADSSDENIGVHGDDLKSSIKKDVQDVPKMDKNGQYLIDFSE